MSFEIKNLPEVIKQAVQYGDLSPKEEVVKTPSKYKAYAFLGATNGQVFCVFAERRIAKDVESILKANYNALQDVRRSFGQDIKAQGKLAKAEERFSSVCDLLPIIELGAGKTLCEFNNLPMFYNF